MSWLAYLDGGVFALGIVIFLVGLGTRSTWVVFWGVVLVTVAVFTMLVTESEGDRNQQLRDPGARHARVARVDTRAAPCARDCHDLAGTRPATS